MRRLAAITLAAAALAGCQRTADAPKRPVQAVATTTVVGDLVQSVGGRRVAVRTLLRPGVDPHTFEPRPSDAVALAKAKLLVSSGGELDDWVEEIESTAGFSGEWLNLFDHLEPVSQEDPHWWQDPRTAIRAVALIRNALIEQDPKGRATYVANARAYTRRLRRLDGSIAACVAKVPAGRRKLVTTHDALGYYARRYHIEVVGALIGSLSTQAQPSGREVQRLVDQVRAEHVRAIFPESALSSRLERAVSRDAGARVGGKLWADSLGPRGSGAETYIGALTANTAAMVEGMSGGSVRCRPAS